MLTVLNGANVHTHTDTQKHTDTHRVMCAHTVTHVRARVLDTHSDKNIHKHTRTDAYTHPQTNTELHIKYLHQYT